MADMVLFKLGTTDLTKYLDKQNFKMDVAPVFDKWTDGNGTNHRNVKRTQITGKAQLGFSKAADFSTVMGLLSSELTADGYYSVTAYVNNTGTTETFNAFIDVTAAAKWDWLNSRQWQTLTFVITQR